MRTAIEISDAIRRHLVARRWKAALATLEQGIITLATLPAEIPHESPFDDPTPITALSISIRILHALEDTFGPLTIGKLRRLMADGKLVCVQDVGVKAESVIHEALARYKPRRNVYADDHRI